jgi:hypothetical protein
MGHLDGELPERPPLSGKVRHSHVFDARRLEADRQIDDSFNSVAIPITYLFDRIPWRLAWRVSETGQHSRYLDVRMGHAASPLRTL